MGYYVGERRRVAKERKDTEKTDQKGHLIMISLVNNVSMSRNACTTEDFKTLRRGCFPIAKLRLPRSHQPGFRLKYDIKYR